MAIFMGLGSRNLGFRLFSVCRGYIGGDVRVYIYICRMLCLKLPNPKASTKTNRIGPVPCIILAWGTSNRPDHDTGNFFGLKP